MKFSDELPSNDILILGRGESLNIFLSNYKKFEHIKHIFLINFSKKYFNNVDGEIFRKKIVHICINIVEPALPFKFLYKYTFGKILFCRYNNFITTNSNLDRKNYKGNIYGNKLEYLPNIMKNYWWLGNTGLLTIAYAVCILKLKKIYIFGFDFYQGKFHNSEFLDGFIHKSLSSTKSLEIANEHHKSGLQLIKNLQKFINDFPATDFYLPNTGVFKNYKQKNVKNIII